MTHPDAVTVLVVDDAADLAELIGAALEAKGYSVRTALDGHDAMAMVEAMQPHCVILDVQMPRLDGYQFAQRLRAKYGDDIVLIAMSGRARDEPEVAGTFRIVDHYLQKPFAFAELDKVLPDLA